MRCEHDDDDVMTRALDSPMAQWGARELRESVNWCRRWMECPAHRDSTVWHNSYGTLIGDTRSSFIDQARINEYEMDYVVLGRDEGSPQLWDSGQPRDRSRP